MSLGLDVFAVSVGVGVRGVPVALRWRIGIAFATAEVTMTVIGIGLGAVAGKLIGDAAGYLGFAALVGVGIYMLIESLRENGGGGIDFSRGWGLILGALSISLDSLGIGFSILYLGVPLGITLLFIALAAGSSTARGLALGNALGARVGELAEVGAGIILILTGAGFAALKAFGHG
jgi:putative Mn2+ efflux pump MntP